MKRKLIFLLIILFLAGLVLAADSPYARRIRPVTSWGTCVENEIAYDMVLHKAGICTNSGYQDIVMGAISYPVTSVFGRTGAIVAATNDYNFNQLAGTATNAQITSLAWSKLTSTPTTIAGYGITDFNSLGDARWSLLAHVHTFASLTSKPTTFSGYGISDTSANFFSAISDEAAGGSVIGSNVTTLSSLVSVGTITTGVWSGTAIVVAKGGTNCTAASITCFNNITGFTTTGTTGLTSQNLVFSNSPALVTPDLGTPSALTLTNATGLPVAGLSNLATNVGTFLITSSSANLRAALTDENGTGAALFSGSTSATFITPVLGVATATSLAAGTNAASSGPIRIPSNSPINARNAANTGNITLIGTDGSDNIGIANYWNISATSGGLSPVGAGQSIQATGGFGTSTTNLLTWTGASALRTMTIPDANFTIARTDAGQTFTGTQAFGAITASGTIIQTSASATAFCSGPAGCTNPVLSLINNTASQADGISITGLAAGNGTTITNLSSGSNSGLNLTLKGTGVFTVTGAASTNIQVWSQAGTDIGAFSTNGGLTTVNGRNANWYDGGSLASLGTMRQQVKGGTAGGFYLDSTSMIGFFSAGISGSPDTTISRNSVGVSQFGTTAVNSSGWFNYAGGNQCFLQADQTNATTTFANINNCSITVTSGRRYTFKAIFYLSDSIAADGAKINFNGGAATSTNFRVHCTAFDSALNLSSQGSALATAYSASTFTGSGMFECHGTFEPSSTSTFIPQFAQNAHTTGTLTIARGSNILMQDVGP